MAELFNRDFEINLGGLRLASRNRDGVEVPMLRVVFEVERTLSKDANTASVQVYNLKRESRTRVADAGIETVLEAGYVGFRHVIFRGKLDFGGSRRERADWVTTFESTDGGEALRGSRINESFAPGVSLEQAITRVAEQLGVGLGNVVEKARAGNVRGAFEDFKNGLTLSGRTQDQLDKLLRTAGLDWSVQDEQLQVLAPGEVIDPDLSIVLNSGTGLLGSPQAGEDGAITAEALLIPSIAPGKRVKIESQQVNGFFRVDRVVFSGDTRGGDWSSTIEATPL